jgi:hypothetical protein
VDLQVPGQAMIAPTNAIRRQIPKPTIQIALIPAREVGSTITIKAKRYAVVVFQLDKILRHMKDHNAKLIKKF